ncbi:LOW QUALITY PROTEIN: isopentenyl-diphosphate delta-isomerase [Geomicrobium sp. JCM 19055]|nr:LOW QUALITY PROTEIN: isopentenyl-diphosphate delta-isomerase [Geomicrobium sp. JCM 19055]
MIKKGYKAYKDLLGSHKYHNFTLHIDHVQADPYASPSRIRVRVPLNRLKVDETQYCDERYVAFTDYLARSVDRALKKNGVQKDVQIDRPSQQILDRTAVTIDQTSVDVRLSLHLPARGRTILGNEAKKRLLKQLPQVVEDGLYKLDVTALQTHLELYDDQTYLRQFLRDENAVAFIANGSVLPRESGVSDRPNTSDDVKRFKSQRVMKPLRSHITGSLSGMLIKRGVTVIVGGGYHGKSTLLKAIEMGVYHHIKGDGREFVITDDLASKIRAEDGRKVTNVDIRPFINQLPNKKSTEHFSTENASGSTSQATNIIEAMEAGANTLLIDEDTSATNFMIRDLRMQQLVAKEKEPITPFIDRVRDLFETNGISTVVVVGGSGDYLEVADNVIMLDEYEVKNVTERAKEIVNNEQSERKRTTANTLGQMNASRMIDSRSFDARRGKREKVQAKGLHTIIYGKEDIDLASVEQLIDPSQTRAIAQTLQYLATNYVNDQRTLSELLDLYEKDTENHLDALSTYPGKHPGDFAKPRRLEVAAAINRLRSLKVKR